MPGLKHRSHHCARADDDVVVDGTVEVGAADVAVAVALVAGPSASYFPDWPGSDLY